MRNSLEVISRFRQVLKRVIVKKSFDYLILFFIALNCITLAMERPSIPPNSFVGVLSSNQIEIPRFRNDNF